MTLPLLPAEQAFGLARIEDWRDLAPAAAERRDAVWGKTTSYSRKIFVPLTKLCRDVCGYCTFAVPPSRAQTPYLPIDEVLGLVRQGAELDCKEVLFTLGDKPELRYTAARNALSALGHASTIDYLAEVARRVRDETGLLPHFNPGILTAADICRLRPLGASMGIMLENTAERLCRMGGPHYGSPDKRPSLRLEMIQAAGEAAVPLTTGILVGIGETRLERIETLLHIRSAYGKYGHIQEVIIQNFRAKPGTKMSATPEPTQAELCWTIAAARLILDADISLQAPPNLTPGDRAELIAAGINDWGGVSPLTPDHVNPEAPWPHLSTLQSDTNRAGHDLAERLTVYPAFVRDAKRWIDPAMRTAVRAAWPIPTDGRVPGAGCPALRTSLNRTGAIRRYRRRPALLAQPSQKYSTAQPRALPIEQNDIVAMFQARGQDFTAIIAAADALRRSLVGDRVGYVITRNINYTNICLYHCGFCAFSKEKPTRPCVAGPTRSTRTRSAIALPRLADVARRKSACRAESIPPSMATRISLSWTPRNTPNLLSTCTPFPPSKSRTVRERSTSLSRASSPNSNPTALARSQGPPPRFSMDEIRAQICPDKLNTAEWLDVVHTAHLAGLRTTSTIMFGHVESYTHWARHLLRLRQLQLETGGITEFVPLPFVHMQTPIYLRGHAPERPHPTRNDPHARGIALGLWLAHPEHPGVLGQTGAQNGGALPAGRRERHGRHADGRVNQPRRGGIARTGIRCCQHGKTHHRRSPHPLPKDDAVQPGGNQGARNSLANHRHPTVEAIRHLFSKYKNNRDLPLMTLRIGYKASAEQFAPSPAAGFRRQRRAHRLRNCLRQRPFPAMATHRRPCAILARLDCCPRPSNETPCYRHQRAHTHVPLPSLDHCTCLRNSRRDVSWTNRAWRRHR